VTLASAPARVTRLLVRHRRVLAATTRLEIDKRYRGSFFGLVWVVLYPVLFLSIYLFLYLVVFKIRLKGLSTLDYVVYIFSGLVPYIAFMETVNASVVSIRQNAHLIRNVILPAELIPTRVVTSALVTESVGLLLVVALSALNGSLSLHLAILPLALAIQLTFLLGVALLLAPLGLMFPDIPYFTGLLILFMLFVSPISWKPSAVPANMRFIVWLNPIYYLLLPFRAAFLNVERLKPLDLLTACLVAATVFVAGTWLFVRLKSSLLEYE